MFNENLLDKNKILKNKKNVLVFLFHGQPELALMNAKNLRNIINYVRLCKFILYLQ